MKGYDVAHHQQIERKKERVLRTVPSLAGPSLLLSLPPGVLRSLLVARLPRGNLATLGCVYWKHIRI